MRAAHNRHRAECSRVSQEGKKTDDEDDLENASDDASDDSDDEQR